MLMDSYWKGRTVFQLKTVPTHRYHSKTSPESKEEPKPTEAQSSTARTLVRNSQGSPDLNTDRGRTLNQKMMTFRDFDDTEFHKVLMELFNTPETETGELRTSDCWIHTPAAWIRFHHVPRRTLYVPDETEVPHDRLGSYRLTLFYKTSSDQDKKSFVDQWRTDESKDVGFVWNGLTLFQTSDCIPDTIVEQETHDKAARDAKALPRPNEPTDQQRATHNLTHLPYRSWCEYCVKSKGRENHSKRQTDRARHSS